MKNDRSPDTQVLRTLGMAFLASLLFLIRLGWEGGEMEGSSQLPHLSTYRQAPCQTEAHLPRAALPPLTGRPRSPLLHDRLLNPHDSA